MKRVISILLLAVIAVGVGIAIGRWSQSTGVDTSATDSERKVLYWKAPMDPNYRREAPGKSPMGMDLVPVYADEAAGDEPDIVRIDPKVAANLGVRTAVVEAGPLSRRIETVGYVGYDEDTLHQINTRVEGWIERLAVKATGDPVKRGQVLFELYSPTLVNAQEEYLAALASSNTMLHRASRERLIALGMTDSGTRRLDKERTVQQSVRIRAEKDGVVSHLGVREGVYITPATNVMSIGELDPIWVVAEVFERQAAWVESGQRAEVALDYRPGEHWVGTVDYVYPELDANTRTLKVRLRFDNPSLDLRPNMFARITIHGAASVPVVHVPREAVIRGGRVHRVVLDLGDGRFRAQPVELGIESGDRIEIRSGLSADDQVVISGQFLIDSESNIESALARMVESEAQMVSPSWVTVAARVSAIDLKARRIELDHDAVEQWSWPAMTMAFDVADVVELAALEQGQGIEVAIERHGDSHYLVSAITVLMDEPLQDKSVPAPHSEDEPATDIDDGHDHAEGSTQ